MAKDSDHLAGTVGSENSGGMLSGLLAEENEFDRRTLWRLGSWGLVAVAAVIVASLANRSLPGARHEQIAADLSRQAEQLQALARESQTDTRRLAAAVDTLNGDRDRLYARVTVLEQGLDSVTGALARQPPAPAATSVPLASPSPSTSKAQPAAVAASAPPDPVPSASPSPSAQAAVSPPAVAAVGTTAAASAERPRPEVQLSAQAPAPAPSASPAPAQEAASQPASSPSPLPKIAANTPPAASVMSLSAPKSLMGPPDPAATKLMEPTKEASKESAKDPIKASDSPVPATSPETASAEASPGEAEAADAGPAKVERTEFAVDLGSANSVGGLRALWRGIVKSNADLAGLHPIIVVKERSNGLGMQLRLAAGPLMDAAAAARICAALIESQRGCETTVYDGQRLALGTGETEPAPSPSPVLKSRPERRHSVQKHVKADDPPKPEPSPSTLSSFFGRK